LLIRRIFEQLNKKPNRSPSGLSETSLGSPERGSFSLPLSNR
jgi:hypothetical protein